MADTLADMLCPRCWGAKVEPRSSTPCGYCGASGVAPDERLSPHFLLSELLHSSTAIARAIANDPTPDQVQSLRRLANDLLEPVRALVGPLHSDSGFRSPALNAVRGGSKTSAHMEACADDVKPLEPGMTLHRIMELIRGSAIPFDQVIFEGSWIHLGILGPGGVQRRQLEMAFPGPDGRMVYQTYNPADARVLAA